MARWLRCALALGLAAMPVACAAPPPPPPPVPPTTVALTLTAGADANPTDSGQGAPVVVRVYQLASAAGFGNAEFFQIYDQDQATLQSDLIRRDDFLLAPAQTRTAILTPVDQVKAIGIFAAYRDYQNATWRGSAEVPPHKTTRLAVLAGRTGITLTTAPDTSGAAANPHGS